MLFLTKPLGIGILTTAAKAELLEPEELREQLRKLTETLSDRYRRN